MSNDQFKEYCEEWDSSPFNSSKSPQRIRVVVRKNRTILTIAIVIWN